MMSQIIFTVVKDAADWQSLTNGRDNGRWFFDSDLSLAVPEKIADEFGDDIYTEAGWNTEPTGFPVLAHIERNCG